MHPRERRKGVRRRLGRRHDVAHLQAPHDERVRNQLPVALPPLRFRAHDRDKAIGGMFAALLPRVSRLVVTRASNARSTDPEALADVARDLAPGLPIAIEPRVEDALADAWRESPRIVVAGSIFLLGDVLKRIGGS